MTQTFLTVILVLCGLMALVFGVHELFLQRRLQRDGIRVPGSVVRYERSSSGEDGGTVLIAIVGYVAEGRQGEIRVTRSGTRKWPIGRQVPVIYLPGAAPTTARIDLGSERRAKAVGIMVLSVVFIVVPIVIMVVRLRHG